MFIELLVLIILVCAFGKLLTPRTEKMDTLQPYTHNGGSVSDTELYYDGRQGRPYGVNNLYRSDSATVQMPSAFNTVMERCADKCFNGVRYIQPIDFLDTHGPVPTEARWCLDECMADSTEPYDLR